MSNESKKPAEFGPVAEYHAHFELWDAADPVALPAPVPSPPLVAEPTTPEPATPAPLAPRHAAASEPTPSEPAQPEITETPQPDTAMPSAKPDVAIDDGDAPPLRCERRVWTTPVLSTSAFPARKANPSQALSMPVLSRDQLAIAAAVTAAVMAMVAMRPWKYFVAATPPANLATQSVSKPAALPQAMPSVAKADSKALAAPANVAVAPPAEPVAMPSVVAAARPVIVAPKVAVQPASAPSVAVSTKIAPPAVKAMAKPQQQAPSPESSTRADEDEAPEATDQTAGDLAQVQAELLRASLLSQMAQAGYPNLGVSVNKDGDVYLDGTFLNQADQDRMIALIRAHSRVRDIYFSGTVWYADDSGAPAADAKEGEAQVAPPQVSAKPAGPSEPATQPPHGKIAHSEDFPITAADETPAPQPPYGAPAPAAPDAMATGASPRTEIWPFRWTNNTH